VVLSLDKHFYHEFFQTSPNQGPRKTQYIMIALYPLVQLGFYESISGRK